MGVDLKSAHRGEPFDPEESLEELAELASSAGAVVLERVVQARPAAEAATLIGRGKVQELAGMVKALRAGAVLFDHELTPTQQRNLEDALDCKILDRTQLILDIFASRARTREGRLQVELAQLSYMLPRLTGKGVEMSRLGGGIGTRGPGETQLETDRRRIARRLKKIREDLENVRSSRALHRLKRNAVPLATVSLVGYTNAGKSTLFNRLTRAGVVADARMFATLDPTVRAVVLPSRRRILLSDTVGFIRNLPTTLVKAFRATLEEVTEAALILHVLDAAAPQAAAHAAHVLRVLGEIDAAGIPQLLVLNKADRLPEAESDPEVLRQRMLGGAAGHTRAVVLSALTGQGVERLLGMLDEVLPFDPVAVAQFRLPLTQGARIALLHQLGRVLEKRFTADSCEIRAEVPASVREALADFVVPPDSH